MKMRTSIILVVVLLTGLLSLAGVAAADDCKGDNANFAACHFGDYFTVTYLQNGQNGQVAGHFTTEVFGYAAAHLTERTYMTRSETDSYYTDLYFTGKHHRSEKNGRPVDDWYTTWHVMIYDKATNELLAAGDFYRAGVVAEFDAVLPFVPGGEPGAGQPTATTVNTAPDPAASSDDEAAAPETTANVQVTPYTAGWTPTIVALGSVPECLVRATYTVRLREAPTTTAPIMDVVPFRTSMPADMRTADDAWMRAYFVGESGGGKLGWISTDYLDQSESCDDIAQAAPVG